MSLPGATPAQGFQLVISTLSLFPCLDQGLHHAPSLKAHNEDPKEHWQRLQQAWQVEEAVTESPLTPTVPGL